MAPRGVLRRTRRTAALVILGLISAMCSLVSSLPGGRGPAVVSPRSPRVGLHGRERAGRTEAREQGMLRLRGGVLASDEESTESSKADKPNKQAEETPLPAAAAVVEDKSSEASDVEMKTESGHGEESEAGGEGEEGGQSEAEVMQRPPPTPEIVRQMNERMWEAAQEGNEPLLAKVLAGGANVNAFCRGPDRWLNISIGEIGGCDEAHTGLNAHWMELNNYTALHLAAACGNAGIIDVLREAGADLNVECLQRVHPFPTHRKGIFPLLTGADPLIFKCTPLRLARAANCGRCFYSSLVTPHSTYTYTHTYMQSTTALGARERRVAHV